jgi:hypothetical protein
VQFDGELVEETVSSRALTVCSDLLGFSPGTAAAVAGPAAAGGAAETAQNLNGPIEEETDESSSEEEPENDSNPHVQRRREHAERLKKEVGKKVQVCDFSLFFFFFARVLLRQTPHYVLLLLFLVFLLCLRQVTNSGVTQTWEVVGAQSVKRDDFPNVAGPRGTEDSSIQTTVLKDCPIVGAENEALKVWLHLYPGKITEDLKRLNAAYKIANPGDKAGVTLHEYVKFIGILHAAAHFTEKGKELWNKESKGIRGAPDMGKYGMTYSRFDRIKRSMPCAFADYSQRMLTPWWKIQGVLDGHNENRKRTIVKSRVQTLDESMSSYKPRTTKTGGLPHLSFIKRKPKPLGTEFKNQCDGIHGVMLFLEVQEGKVAMRRKRHAGRLGVNSACAMRVSVGALS